MVFNRWQSGERRSAAGELSRALQVRPDLDPHTRAQIEHIISARRHAGRNPEQSVIDEIGREVRSMNAFLGEQAPRGGTMSDMDRQRLQQEAGAIAERLRDRNTSPAEQRQLAARLGEIRSAMNRPAGGQILINLYAWRHGLQDLEQWYRSLGAPSGDERQDYQQLHAEMQRNVDEAQRRFETDYRDAARAALEQAQLTRSQVERELTNAIATNKNLKPEDIDKFGKGLRAWQRFGMQVLGGAIGAAGGATMYGKAAALAGLTAASPVIAKTALATAIIGTGAMVGTALFRYVPRLMPFYGRRARRAARAEEADSRRGSAMRNRELVASMAEILEQNVANEAERTRRMSEIVAAEYGKRGGYVMREVRQITKRAAVGSIVATAGGVGAAFFQDPTLASKLEFSSNAAKAIGGAALAQMQYAFNTAIAAPIAWLLTQGSKIPGYIGKKLIPPFG